MGDFSQLYSFTFRGLLAEESVNSTGLLGATNAEDEKEVIAKLVGLDSLGAEYLVASQNMAVIYSAIAAFENSVRDFISSTLLKHFGINLKHIRPR